MDTLSLLVDNMRLRGGRFIDCILRQSGALRMSSPGQSSFHVLRQGEGWLLHDDHAALKVAMGDIVILPGGMDHCLQSDPEPDLLPSLEPLNVEDGTSQDVSLGSGAVWLRTVSGHFRFDAELARPLTAALPEILHIPAPEGRMPAWLGIGLQFIDEERHSARPAHQAITDRIADVMLIFCLREYVERLGEDSGNWLLALKDRSLSAALSAMHRAPERPWTVNDLAVIATTSRSVFAERFTQVVGQPPLAYLTEHRMRLASWQLRETQQPIYRIAAAVGYGSEAAFSQAFKRYSGLSPSAYRKHS